MNRAGPALIVTLAILTFVSPGRTLAADAVPAQPADAPAPANPTPWAFGTTVASRYLFQGIDYSGGRPVVQPQVALAWRGSSLQFWGNMGTDDWEMNEIDLSVQHEVEIRRLSVTAGIVDLRYPHRDGWGPTREMFVDVALDTPLAPSVSTHYDFEAATGAYVTFSLSQALGKASTVPTISTRLFWQRGYYGMSGVPAVELNCGTEISAGGVKLAPSVSRFLNWKNGTFRGDDTVRGTWTFALGISRGS